MSDDLSTVETENKFVNLLELAANNDLGGFKNYVDCKPSSIDEVGLWYGRRKGSNQMVLQHRTPLMVAATYGSIDVLKQIISFPEVDVNRSCGIDRSTALHCAASGGSVNAVNVVKLLLAMGADRNLANANGRCPLDVIIVSPKFQEMRYSLQMMLTTDSPFQEEHTSTPLLSPSLGNGSPLPNDTKNDDVPVSYAPEKKEYPVDLSLPDIKNSIYSTDEFRMFSFKVRPCSRAYSHDWTECPFVHPGENARRRDPRKYHYSSVPCPDFRKGACRRGDVCEYAHGVFECWLHPAQYRTRVCKDGTSCNRRVCFFAHAQEELRPLYVSTGSAVQSPRSSTSSANARDFRVAMGLLPGSPSPFTPPMSPSNDRISDMGWPPQQNIPPLHLLGSNFQPSRLRLSFNATDILAEDLGSYADNNVQQQQLINELSCLSQQSNGTNLVNRTSKTLTPTNLEDVFCAESSSPRYSEQAMSSAIFLPTHKSAVLNQFQHHQQNMQSPIRTDFSPRILPFGLPSPGRVSPQSVEPVSPMISRMSMIAQREMQHQQFWSLSSRDLGASLEDSWSMWETPNGTSEGAITANEFDKLGLSSSVELLNNGEEPDLLWVQSLVKESPQDMKEKSAAGASSVEGESSKNNIEHVDQSVLGAWLEKMQLDQLMPQ